jgi:dTDP-4-amino-4,6-dideoxygalactose transaminase
MKEMTKKGIETGIHYRPVHTMKFYSDSTKLKNCENISKEIVSIPMHANLSDEEIEKIISCTNKFAE